MEILQVIYRCIYSALRWYEFYSQSLEKEGFIIHHYDKYVANKTINGIQCTVIWYADDKKVSYIEPKVVSEVIELMKKHFGKLTVTRGNKYSFLVMSITVIDNKHVEIEMKDQLQELIDIFEGYGGEEVNKITNLPAQNTLTRY